MIAAARRFFQRAAALFRKEQLDDDFAEELAAHVEHATQDFVQQGLSPKEARRRALLELGRVEQTRELHRDSRGLPWLEAIGKDLALAVRTLRRHATVTAFALLIVGLGVGAATTVYSVVSALLLRPFPFEAPQELVWIANGTSTNLSAQTVQVGNLLDFQERSESFEDIAGFNAFYGAGDIRLSGAGEPRRLTGVPVTENFFRLLGVKPFLGRTFTPTEVASRAPRVLLSHRLWQRQFGSDPNVAGSTVQLGTESHVIVGVLPESFDFSAIFTPGKPADLFKPFPLDEDNHRRGNTLALVGRLSEGADLASAQTEATWVAERVAAEHNDERRNDFTPHLSSLRERVSGDLRQALLILAGAVGLLMLIVCANLSNLLLARAQGRRREMAVRVALGAGRRRLLRLLLIESLVLSACGALLGLGLARAGTGLLARIEGTTVPLLSEVRIDPAALGFALLLTLATGLLFGLTPALQASSVAPAHALREAGRTASTGRRGRWLRQALVVFEIALTCVLLTAVGLFLRSLVSVLEVDLGFEPENVMALRVDPGRGMMQRAEERAYFDAMLERVAALPGVESVGMTDALPLGDNFGWRTWDASGVPAEETVHPLVRLVDEGYMPTLGISLRAGRLFDLSDHTESDRVTIVNQPLADRLWPGREPLGQTLVTSGHEYRVVGVVDEARYFDLERRSGPEMYLPLRQVTGYSTLDLVVRTRNEPLAQAPALRRALASVDPNLPTAHLATMEQLVDRSTFSRRSMVSLLAGFALFALILASLGVYGVISFAVTQQRKEMGVRLAFGASPASLQRRVLGQTMAMAMAGMALGVAGSWLLARGLEGLLFGVTPADPPTYLTVLAVLAACTALASYLPARRTSRLDVIDALRAE